MVYMIMPGRPEFLGIQYTAVSRKLVGKNVQATIPKGNKGCDEYTVFLLTL